MELIVCVIEWEKQGCFKEVKKKNKAMGKVLGKFRKYKKNIKGAVEACMKAAKGKKLEIFGVRGKFSCATTKGNADYNVHFSSSWGDRWKLHGEIQRHAIVITYMFMTNDRCEDSFV